MGVNISGKGVLSGLATLVAGVVNNFNLLVTRIIGSIYIPGTGGSSYYTTMVGASGTGLVALSSGAAVYSSLDGENWTEKQIDLGDTTFIGSTYVNNKHFAVSTFGKIVSSEDGVNWTITADLSIFSVSPSWGQMMYGAGLYVVVNTQSGSAVYSTDAISWYSSIVTATAGVQFNYQAIQFVGGKFVLISNSGQTYYSLDGTNWQEGTNLDGTNWYMFAYVNNKYIAVSNSGLTASSLDGITWTSGTTLPNATWESLPFYGVGKYILVSRDSKTAYSTDGVTWSNGMDLSSQMNPSKYLNEINGTVVALAQDVNDDYKTVTISTSDGINWYTNVQYALTSSQYPYDVYYVDNKYVTISIQGHLIFSLDGINWWSGTTLPGAFPTYYTGLVLGNVSTLVETQVSIGDQGTEGSEVLAPVDVYTVPTGKTTSIDEVKIKNTSANTITYDLGVIDDGVSLTDGNALINDALISAGATATINSITTPMTAGQRIVVFPSAVDVVEVKVYGTETSI